MCWYQVERQRSIVFYFIVLNWKTTIVDSRKALYLSYFQNWFSTSMCQQSIMVFINLFSSNLLYRYVVPCLNRLTLVEGLNFQNNLASLNIQGALPLSIFVSIFIFFKNASVAIELLSFQTNEHGSLWKQNRNFTSEYTYVNFELYQELNTNHFVDVYDVTNNCIHWLFQRELPKNNDILFRKH